MKMTARRLGLTAGAVALAGTFVLGQQGPPPQQGQGQQGQQGAQGRGRDANMQAPVGTGAITGFVLSEGTGTPVRRARVNLSGAALRGGRTAMTTDDGRFSFAGLPAGRYTMTASKAGFVDIAYGAKRAGRPGTPIELADAQKIEKAVINLPKGGVVTGIVIDDNGEPSPNTTVRAYRFVMRTGERTLQQTGTDTTDDRGMYRIFGLQPGDYIVNAVPRNQSGGDMLQTLRAEMEVLQQELQMMAAAEGRGGGGRAGGAAGGAAGGGGGRGGQGGRGGDPMGAFPGGRGAFGGRGGVLGDRLEQIQAQLQQAEQEQTVAYAPVYYPGTTLPSGASTVTLAVGDERQGVDFQLRLVQTARITGTIVGPDGTLPPGTQIGLVAIDPGGNMPNIPGAGMNMSRTDNTGQFTFSGIAPGQYRLMARAAIRQAPPAGSEAAAAQAGRGGDQGRGRGPGGPGQITQVLWASSDVSVSGQNITGLALTLQPGMTISGRVQFEGTTAAPPTDLTRVRVNLAPRGQQLFDLGGGAPPAQVDASGRFSIAGVVPGKYSITASAPSGNAGQGQGRAGGAAQAPGTTGQPAVSWRLKSAVAAGRDVLDFPLIIEPNQEVSGALLTFTDRTQEVSGTIQDTMGRPTADYTIIIFPIDNRYWQPSSRRIASSRPGTDGKFTFRELPPGDYRITAVTDVEPGEWYNPDFLQQLISGSISVSIQAGERKVQDIRLAGGS
jgi:uncharacterized protein (DUF2141 family)